MNIGLIRDVTVGTRLGDAVPVHAHGLETFWINKGATERVRRFCIGLLVACQKLDGRRFILQEVDDDGVPLARP